MIMNLLKPICEFYLQLIVVTLCQKPHMSYPQHITQAGGLMYHTAANLDMNGTLLILMYV